MNQDAALPIVLYGKRSMLSHVSKCVRKRCTRRCHQSRRELWHFMGCTVKIRGGCATCRRVMRLISQHSASCTTGDCYVLFCNEYRRLKRGRIFKHKQKHTAGGRIFKCDQCDYETKHSGNLVRHKRKHTKEKQWICPICEKTYSRPDNLKTHIACKHSSRPAFSCSKCDFTCRWRKTFENHRTRCQKLEQQRKTSAHWPVQVKIYGRCKSFTKFVSKVRDGQGRGSVAFAVRSAACKKKLRQLIKSYGIACESGQWPAEIRDMDIQFAYRTSTMHDEREEYSGYKGLLDFLDKHAPRDRADHGMLTGTRRRNDSLASEQQRPPKKARVSQTGETEIAQVMVGMLPNSCGVA